jgi:MSHA pilin protein MshA
MIDAAEQQVRGIGSTQGFALIELIIIVVILGILSVVAVPKYMDIKSEAARAAAEGVYGTAQSGCAIGFSARLVSPTMGSRVTDGSTLAATFDGGLPDGWTARGNSISATIGGNTYVIGVATAEDTSSKAVLGKTGF